MFCISYPKQEDIVKDLKIILDFKASGEQKSESKFEFSVNQKNAILISALFSTNLPNKNEPNVFKQTITMTDDQLFSTDLFISLITLIFNNDPIKYSNENYLILHKISEIFGIQKLKTSIERYESYLDRINSFTFGRLPIIDNEFLCRLYLQDLSDSNTEDTRNASIRFIEELSVETYSYILYQCIYTNFSNSPSYLTFITKEMPKNYYQDFVKTLERLFRFCSFGRCISWYSLPLLNCLFRYFMENGLIQYEDCEAISLRCFGMGYTYQYIDYDHGNIHYDPSYYVYRHYEEISKDNFSLHRKLVMNGHNQNPLFQMIEKDDIESLSNYLAFNPEASIDTIIEKCYYEARSVFQNDSYSLIEIAAYFGSVNVFKYLISNNAIIRNEQMSLMAIYGGNPEIIRICKQKNVSFQSKSDRFDHEETVLQIAVKMNHFEILRWLIEEEKCDIENDGVNLIGFALQVSNFEAFYYLISQVYDTKFTHENGYEEEEQEHEEEEKKEFVYNFSKVLKYVFFSYNMPVLKNYLEMKGKDLVDISMHSQDHFYDKYLMDIILGNYDYEIIDLLLENNEMKYLEKIPIFNFTSLEYQKMAKYLLSHKNVTFTDKLFEEVKKNLLIPDKSLLSNIEFVKEQVHFLYDYSKTPIEKLKMLPLIFRYDLYDSDISQKYKDYFTKSGKPVKFPPEILPTLAQYIDVDTMKFIYLHTDKKCIKKGYSLCELTEMIEKGKMDMFLFLLTSEIVPFSFRYKYTEDSFFELFRGINKVDDLIKLIQLYSNKMKDCKFYEDIFLPNVLYNLNRKNEVINEYLINLPDIEPYLNKENKKFKNYPPLFYSDYFEKYWTNEKFDINIRKSDNNYNLLCHITEYDSVIRLLNIDRFEYTLDDIMIFLKHMYYPYSKEILELFLNGLLYGEEKSQIKLKIELNFNDDQINQIFHLICISDDRLDMAKDFYNKFSDRIDINYLFNGNRLVILDAIDCNAIVTVKFLLSIKGIDLNKRGNTGSMGTHDYVECTNITPFCFAVECKLNDIINLFANKYEKFNVNETYTNNVLLLLFNEITCLHTAAKSNNIWLIQFLLNIPDIDTRPFDIVFIFNLFHEDFIFFIFMKNTF